MRQLINYLLATLIAFCAVALDADAITSGKKYRIKQTTTGKYISTKESTTSGSYLYLENLNEYRSDMVWLVTISGSKYSIRTSDGTMALTISTGNPTIQSYDASNSSQQCTLSGTSSYTISATSSNSTRYLTYASSTYTIQSSSQSNKAVNFTFEEVTEDVTTPDSGTATEEETTNTTGITTDSSNDWQNETTYGINKEAGHATYIPFPSTSTLQADNTYAQPWLTPCSADFLDLNGTWNFNFVSSTDNRPNDATMKTISGSTFTTSSSSLTWNTIPVPSCMEMEGYDKPMYVNVEYIFADNPPYIGSVSSRVPGAGANPVGTYQRTFTLPSGWENQRVYWHSDGLYSAAYLWVNGTCVGYTQGGNMDAEFDITPYVKTGTNGIAVQVIKWSDGSYLEGQDMWHMSGLHRDVYLYATPKTAIRDHYITSTLSASSYTSGTMDIKLTVDNRDKTATSKTIKVTLLDPSGSQVYSTSQNVTLTTSESTKTVNFSQSVSNLKLWSAEEPNLYTVIFSQMDASGNEEMAFQTKYGFRHIEISNKLVYINGKKVYFRGVNTQDTDPVKGRSIPVETMLKDVTMMKQANINTVRTSHYPRQAKMMAMFDYYGLYVIDEADVECHKAWGDGKGLSNSSSWKEQYIDRTERMVYRDRNHPSVVFWSLGNESGSGSNFDATYARCHELDSRYVHLEGYDSASDLATSMYPTVSAASSKCNSGTKPYIMCEYAHAMGNAIGNLQEYWDIIESSTNGIGGCIWDWVDQSIYDPAKKNMKNENGFDYYISGYDNRTDEIHQYNFLNNGIIPADRSWSAKLTAVKKVYQPAKMAYSNGTLTITNKFAFANLSDYFELYWAAVDDGKVSNSGTMTLPSIAAGSSGQLSIPCTSEYLNIELRLKANARYADKGYAQCTEQFRVNATQTGVLSNITSTDALSIATGSSTYTISNANCSLVVGNDGYIDSFTSNGVDILATTNVINQPIYSNIRWVENEGPYPDYNNNFGDTGYNVSKVSFTAPALSSDKTSCTFSASMRYSYSLTYTINYTLYGDGTLDMKVSYTPSTSGLRRIGLDMKFPAGYEEVEYYAQGPDENYCDRQAGSYMGRYTATIDEMFNKAYTHPQSNGNRIGLRDMTLKSSTNDNVIHVATAGDVSFSLSHYNQREFNVRKLHPWDLTRYNEIFATFDYMQRGLGNNSCGGDGALSAYQCPSSGTYTHTIRLWGGTDTEVDEETLLKRSLQSLVNRATSDYTNSVVAGNDETYDNADISTVDGLVTTADQLRSNTADASEGTNMGNLVDASTSTFWHADWHSASSDTYNFQVQLSESASDIIVKIASRNHDNRNEPVTMQVFGCNDTPQLFQTSFSTDKVTDSTNWTDEGTLTMDYKYSYDSSSNYAVVGLGTFSLSQPYKYLRFNMLEDNNSSTKDFSFSMSELRIYKNSSESNADLYPNATTAFRNSYDAAKSALESGTASQELINALQTAWEDYLNAVQTGTDIGDTPATIKVTSITISNETTTLEEGQTLTLEATVLPANATNKAVTWSSSDEKIATVSTAGVVTAVSAGTVTIKATAQDGSKVEGTITITVTAKPVENYAVNFDKTTLYSDNYSDDNGGKYIKSISLSGTKTASQEITVCSSADDTNYKDLTTQTFTCEAGEELNTIITTNGEWLHGYVYIDLGNDGQFSYHDLSTDQSGTDLVSFCFYNGIVDAKDDTTAGVNSLGENISGDARNFGKTISNPVFTAPTTPGTYRMRFKTDWNSVDPGGRIATDGTCTGTNGILATGGGIVDVMLKVNAVVEPEVVAVTGITLTATTTSIEEGQTVTVTAAVAPTNATNKAVTWSSSDEKIATVTEEGVVTAVSAGTVTIKATAQDGSKVEGTIAITVTAKAPEVIAVTGITLNATATSIEEGESVTVTAAVAPINATNKAVTWSSSSNDIATVSADGVVTAVSAGTVIIKAAAADGSGVVGSITITVTAKEPEVIAVSGITLTAPTTSIEEGETVSVTAAVAPTNATNQTVNWSSSDETIATVSSTGIVTAVSAGTAVITATATDGSQVEGSITITVTAKIPEPEEEVFDLSYVDSPYTINFDKTSTYGGSRTNKDRYISSISLKNGNDAQQTLTVGDVNGTNYKDLTSSYFTCDPGATITATIGFIGEWMHGYIYIDQNGDGTFAINDSQIDQSDMDIVSFSYYNAGGSIGYNSKGSVISNANVVNTTSHTITLPTFTAPSNSGYYFMRYKVDWNSLEPGGYVDASNNILANGGGIVDVILKVGEPVTGDVDCDGECTIVDLADYIEFMNGNVYIIPAAADINGDGELNSKDFKTIENNILEK